MSRLGNAAAFGVGFMSSYAAGKQNQREEERQRKEDEWRDEERARLRAERAEKDALNRDIKEAAAPVSVKSGATVTGIAPQPATYDDAGIANSDMREARRGGVTASVQPTNVVAGKAYGDQAGADYAAGQLNAPGGRMQRVSDAYAKAGKIEESDRLHKRADELKTEGALEFIKDLRTSVPDAAEIEKSGGVAPVTISEASRKNFDGLGKMRLPEGAQAQAFVQTLEDGTKIADIRLLDKNGKVLVPSANTVEGMIGMSLAERQAQQRDERTIRRQVGRDKVTDANNARDFGLRDKVADANIKQGEGQLAISRAQLGISGGHLALARSEAARRKEEDPFNKLPGPVKLRYTSLANESKSLSDVIAKAMADDTFKPDSPGGQKLLGRQQELSLQMNELLSAHLKDTRPPDPLGLLGPPGPQQPAAQVPGAQQPPPQQPAPAQPGVARRMLNTVQGAIQQPQQPAYVPPPNSPVAIQRGRMEAAAAQAQQQQAAQDQQNAQAAAQAATAALQAGDKRAGYTVMQQPGFGLLPPDVQKQVSNLVNSR